MRNDVTESFEEFDDESEVVEWVAIYRYGKMVLVSWSYWKLEWNLELNQIEDSGTFMGLLSPWPWGPFQLLLGLDR